MISDNIIKQQFITGALNEGFRQINEAQRKIATENIYAKGKKKVIEKRKGKTIQQSGYESLVKSLISPPYDLKVPGTTAFMTNRILKQMRFLDMKNYGNWRIYNAQVWGILYNETFPEIKYGFGDEVYKEISKQLETALK